MMFRLTFVCLLLGISACDGEPVAAAQARVQAADFDLEGTAALVRDGKVKDGESLQKALNRSGRSKIDLDGDGKRDPIQVVERRDGEKRALEIRAIPSSRQESAPDEVAVPVAVMEFAPESEQAEVTVRYVDGVIVAGPAPVITFVVVVNVHVFCRWLFIVDRPIYIGTVIVVHHHHHHKHKKHKKHKKHRHR